MEIQIRAPHADIKKGVRAYAEQKIGGALQKVVGKEGSKLDIEISDLSNGTGAPSMRVSVHVSIPHSKTVVVHAEDGDVGAAIDLAADKALRAVVRVRKKRRDRQRASHYSLPAVPPTPYDDDEESIQPITL